MFQSNKLSALCTRFGHSPICTCNPCLQKSYRRVGNHLAVILSVFLLVGCRADGEPVPVFMSAASRQGGVRLDLNRAGISELEGLPGIGVKTATRIIEFRERNGHFRRTEHLMLIDGISERKFLAIAPHIEVR